MFNWIGYPVEKQARALLFVLGLAGAAMSVWMFGESLARAWGGLWLGHNAALTPALTGLGLGWCTFKILSLWRKLRLPPGVGRDRSGTTR